MKVLNSAQSMLKLRNPIKKHTEKKVIEPLNSAKKKGTKLKQVFFFLQTKLNIYYNNIF